MDDPMYEAAADATAHILNHYWGKDEPKPVLFSKIVYTILEKMKQVKSDRDGIRFLPSDN